MDFVIADTFTASLARLTSDEQKAVKTTAFDLQINPANPGMSLHKLDRARDQRFWSVRVSADLRLILHRTDASLMLCYVDHHDRAYRWAERRKLETHPTTGAAQLVEIRERVEEITIPRYVEATGVTAAPKPPLFSGLSDDALLGYGVPAEWLADARAANEDSLMDLVDHLPAEAGEALLELATGGKPRPIPSKVADPFAHPDALRRFRVMKNLEELAQALEFPWEKWTVFLHPSQREWVERDYSGPARVSGSAGTGKTIVALHRAVRLARTHPEARVLLTTFSEALAQSLRVKLRRLIGQEPSLAERLEVHALDTIGERLYRMHLGQARLATREDVRAAMRAASETIESHRFTLQFLMTEWRDVVDAWQLKDWAAYRDVRRLGRKTRLSEAQRATLWAIFEQVRADLDDQGLITRSRLFTELATKVAGRPPFDFAVIDEAQDLNVPQLRFLAALGTQRTDALFFAGDLGQRIFQQPFSWKSVGVDVRGRSRTLQVNYRTSHQIRAQADRLLAPELSDVDGNVETRGGTVSVFNGPAPHIQTFDHVDAEVAGVGAWLKKVASDTKPEEIGIFVRSDEQLDRACAALDAAGLPYQILDEGLVTTNGQIAVGTMHLAKGLEFKVVIVMACDDEVIPLQARIDNVGDDADLEEVYNTERHLLYVACTRARDRLFVSGVEPASEFLEDLAV
ncbi:DNA/RNA helicase, superfamily I [Thioflavicoccus mobilis 8321]|uniref:DNA 3'-5' helicase n=1 Tax=Thioflavicoccus mobilis 8321 TaxID=765912 RepID=L0H3C0_9GAMM|nr:3'-5' exonuclease [Thioflavicoccus mobilis]AGA92084.1 DNA/RNA helicase, superfamily I [Thioflavicoccus mobilis 8321]